jgi:hypothetical protein
MNSLSVSEHTLLKLLCPQGLHSYVVTSDITHSLAELVIHSIVSRNHVLASVIVRQALFFFLMWYNSFNCRSYFRLYILVRAQHAYTGGDGLWWVGSLGLGIGEFRITLSFGLCNSIMVSVYTVGRFALQHCYIRGTDTCGSVYVASAWRPQQSLDNLSCVLA